MADPLDTQVDSDMQSLISTLGADPNVTSISIDDHLSIPDDPTTRAAFFARHQNEINASGQTPEQWATEQFTFRINHYANLAHQAGKEFTVSIGGVYSSDNRFVDPAQLIELGNVDNLEFQVYQRNDPNANGVIPFNNDLEGIRELARNNPEDFAKLSEVRVAVTEDPGVGANNGVAPLDAAGKNQQLDAINQLQLDIDQILTNAGQPANVEVGVSYFSSTQNPYFD